MKQYNKVLAGSIIAGALALAPLAFAEDVNATPTTGTTAPTAGTAPTMMRDHMKDKKEGKRMRKGDTKEQQPVDFATAKAKVTADVTAMQTAITAALAKLSDAKASVDASTDDASLKKAQQSLRMARIALAQALNGDQKPPMKGLMKKDEGDNSDNNQKDRGDKMMRDQKAPMKGPLMNQDSKQAGTN